MTVSTETPSPGRCSRKSRSGRSTRQGRDERHQWPTLDRLEDLGPLPDDITVHLDAGYDSDKTRTELAARNLNGRIAHKSEKARSRRADDGTSSAPTPGKIWRAHPRLAKYGMRLDVAPAQISLVPDL
jgi:hypothetical protein